MKFEQDAFDTLIDGKPVGLYELKAGKLQVAVTNYGARTVHILFPDKGGRLTELNVGFPSIAAYLASSEVYYGAIIGRFANRIREGKFILGDKVYQLAVNNGPNHLHGGTAGFHHQVWEVKEVSDQALDFHYTSPDGEEGYPGNLTVTLRFMLDENSLSISYTAVSDEDTVINLTAHPFFNLNGIGSGTVNGHWLQLAADTYTPIDKNAIPTGEIAAVEGTPFDFRTARTIGSRMEEPNEQLENGYGYDHNFVLDKRDNWRESPVATATGDRSGICMETFTDQPGLQFYSGNFMKGANIVNGSFKDERRTAFCLETQHYPDSPNQPLFPSTVLKAGETFSTQTVYRFSIAQQM